MSFASLNDLFNGARPDDHPIARTAWGIMTVRQLRADVGGTIAQLTSRNIRRALLVCDDSYRFLVGLLALLQTGAEIVLPPNIKLGMLRTLYESCDAIVTDNGATGIDDAIAPVTSDCDIQRFALDIDNRPIDFFTSGSTGEMKRVRKTLGAFAREAAMLDRLWGETLHGAMFVGMMTHQHVFGMTFRIMWPLLAGRCFDSTVHFAWESLLAALTSHAVIVTSPAHLTRLGGVPPLSAGQRPAMIFTAGAPLSAATVREVAATLGTLPTEIFGSTETGVVAWRTGPSDDPLWQPLPGVEIRVNDAGLLRVISDFLDGAPWRDLADRVTSVDGGRFRFEGRADRIVKIEGTRVSLQEIERAVVALPWIAEACVVPVETGRLLLGAVVVLSETGRTELASLGKFSFVRLLRRELAVNLDLAVTPRRWRFLDRMPADGMGKRRVQDFIAVLTAPA